MINTKEQAVYVRLKAEYIGREKKRKIINICCGFPRWFKRKFLVYFLVFLFVVFCFLLLLLFFFLYLL